jgi:effector-binding domain-containing protein
MKSIQSYLGKRSGPIRVQVDRALTRNFGGESHGPLWVRRDKPWGTKKYGVLIILLMIFLACSSKKNEMEIRIEQMPELRFISSEYPDSFETIEDGLSAYLEIYAEDPESYGEPLAVIDDCLDSSIVRPITRRYALVYEDNDKELPEGYYVDYVTSGKAILCKCRADFESIDSCWNAVEKFISQNRLAIIAPAIELYRDFPSEENGQQAVELVVRVR